MKQVLPQKCPIAFLYLTWLIYAAGAAYLALRGELAMALVWLVAVPVGLWAYVRVFPRVSHLLGYGRVSDVRPEAIGRHDISVTMYSALGCPFCPIVEKRLQSLQEKMGFDLRHVDVTLRPDVLRAKGIKSVPVVEVNDRRLVGHATTRELANLVRGAG